MLENCPSTVNLRSLKHFSKIDFERVVTWKEQRERHPICHYFNILNVFMSVLRKSPQVTIGKHSTMAKNIPSMLSASQSPAS